ncbi:MAG: choice-of-anchor V domain-containing protein [Bacteroidota bacterium]|nr:choice-of-anchor V domain-containing protein [Bacteroidota bacterium]
MKKRLLINLAIGSLFIIFLTSAINNANGPGGGYTNAPNESNCTSCHGGSLITTGTQLNSLRFGGNFTGNGYLPDSTYTLAVTFKQTGRSKFGFQITALNASNDPIGSFTNTNNRTSRVTATVSSKTREYIQHTSTGTANVGTDSTRWTFDWKAPNSNVGKITFYVVVMATDNNNSNNSGDLVYAKTFEVLPSSLLPVATATTSTNPLCTNSNINFNGSGTNSPTSYAWQFPGGTPSSSTLQNPSVAWGSIGQKLAILRVRNSKGQSAPDTLKITLTASPAATISNGTSASICKGDSIQLIANNLTNHTYLWQPINKTTRTITAKDTGNYRVRVTNNTSGCSTLSNVFRLNHFDEPSISISNKSGLNNFCDRISDSFFAQGQFLDTVLWYINGNLSQKTNGVKAFISFPNNANITAIGKSSNGCLSAVSNSLNLTITPKLYPSNFSVVKTTSTIRINWKKNSNISQYQYSINQSGFSSTTADSFLFIDQLTANTNYNITIRSFQSGVCQFSDTSFLIKTSACSNMEYSINYGNRVCAGTSININIQLLYKSNYSVSFNNGTRGLDTIFSFVPTKSDTIRISIIDSNSLNCPPIIEKIPYIVDVLPDNDDGIYNQSVCQNTFVYTVLPLYSNFKFYKNNTIVYDGPDSSFTYQGLNNNDQVKVICKFNTCNKTYGPITIKTNVKPNVEFSFIKNWYNYQLTPLDLKLSNYTWRLNDSLISNSQSVNVDMRPYTSSDVKVALTGTDTMGCQDSSIQTLSIPDFTNIHHAHIQSFVKIFPNPFDKQLKIQANEPIQQIRVLNNLGQIIFENNASDLSTEINTIDWKKGLYIIMVSSNQETSIHKFIKQ